MVYRLLCPCDSPRQEYWSGLPFPSPILCLQHPAAAAAKSLQSYPTLCDPIDGSPPGSPSLGFSRQEHWSGLPFPSPMHESEKWKWSCSVVSDSWRPHGLQPTRPLPSMGFSRQEYGVGCHCLLRYIILLISNFLSIAIVTSYSMTMLHFKPEHVVKLRICPKLFY